MRVERVVGEYKVRVTMDILFPPNGTVCELGGWNEQGGVVLKGFAVFFCHLGQKFLHGRGDVGREIFIHKGHVVDHKGVAFFFEDAKSVGCEGVAYFEKVRRRDDRLPVPGLHYEGLKVGGVGVVGNVVGEPLVEAVEEGVSSVAYG